VHAAFFASSKKFNRRGITEKDLTQAREPALEQNKVSLKQNDYWLQNLQASFLNETDLNASLPGKTAERYYTAQLINGRNSMQSSVFKAIWLPEK
jgi:hypothetical protein